MNKLCCSIVYAIVRLANFLWNSYLKHKKKVSSQNIKKHFYMWKIAEMILNWPLNWLMAEINGALKLCKIFIETKNLFKFFSEICKIHLLHFRLNEEKKFYFLIFLLSFISRKRKNWNIKQFSTIFKFMKYICFR